MQKKVAENYYRAYLEQHPVRIFHKGEIIVFQGEAPRGAYIVKSGTIKAYNLSVGGDEKPVAFYPKGAVFPGAWVYGKAPNAIYYYEAFSDDVEVYLVAREEYLAFIKKHPDLLYLEFERHVVDELGKSMRINALQYSRASDKLLYTLHYLALSHGQKLDSTKTQILLDLTHQDFANLTGLTRETAATELNKLKRSGVISYGKNQPYVLNLKKLMSSLNDQYLQDLEKL